MNNKQKVILIFAVVWACAFGGYVMTNLNVSMVQPASNYNSGGFTGISHLATGYFNDTNKQLSHMPKLMP